MAQRGVRELPEQSAGGHMSLSEQIS